MPWTPSQSRVSVPVWHKTGHNRQTNKKAPSLTDLSQLGTSESVKCF
jgi:hypothetical protein